MEIKKLQVFLKTFSFCFNGFYGVVGMYIFYIGLQNGIKNAGTFAMILPETGETDSTVLPILLGLYTFIIACMGGCALCSDSPCMLQGYSFCLFLAALGQILYAVLNFSNSLKVRIQKSNSSNWLGKNSDWYIGFQWGYVSDEEREELSEKLHLIGYISLAIAVSEIVNVVIGYILAHHFNKVQRNPIIIQNPTAVAWIQNHELNPFQI